MRCSEEMYNFDLREKVKNFGTIGSQQLRGRQRKKDLAMEKSSLRRIKIESCHGNQGGEAKRDPGFFF